MVVMGYINHVHLCFSHAASNVMSPSYSVLIVAHLGNLASKFLRVTINRPTQNDQWNYT